eukprot:scaffold16184_cov139-Skeletonema_marinoi.AAC.2
MVDNPKLKHQRSDDADTSHSTKKEPVETVDDDDGNDGKLEIGGSLSETKALVENAENEQSSGALSLMESIWPPNPSGWTIYDAITTETWSSKTTKEAFDFPIITICGDDVGRKHTIISHNCLLYDYLHHDEDDEDYHEKPTCESFEASNLDENIINPDEVTGPCVVYNSNKALRTDIDGYYEMVVQFNAILSDSEEITGGGDDMYPMPSENYPRAYLLFLSDDDLLSRENTAGWWTSIPIPEAGKISYTVNLAVQDYGRYKNDVYSIENYVHLPWENTNVDGNSSDLTSTFTEVWISSSEAGVMKLTKVQPSISVIAGSLWGLFGLVFTAFYVCFAKDLKRPGVLVRRVRGLKSLTKKDSEELIGVGSEAASIVDPAKLAGAVVSSI